MSRLHQAWEKIPLEGDFQLISADEVRQLTGREPRLMMKFDHSSQLPPKLRDSGRFILPLKNGLYAILEGEGYHRPESCGEVEEFARKTRFNLQTTSTGLSEMQHLDIAFNSGLLGHFLGESVLYSTIRGRKRSPQFEFRVGSHQLEAIGVQVEIDGGFEARQSVTLIEAKIGEAEDFHLRQLYYPFRFWSTQTKKKVRPVFFTYEPETQIYRFREYCFEPAEEYTQPHLVKAGAYRISDCQDFEFQPLTKPSKYPFPQADRLDKIALIPFVAAEGHTQAEQIAEIFEFSPRQGRYYLDACKALGLLDRDGHPTELGMTYLRSTPDARHHQLCKAVLAFPVVAEVFSNLLLAPNSTLSKQDVQSVVAQATSLGTETAKRRTQTLWSWLLWISNYLPQLQVEQDRVRLSSERPTQPKTENVQLGLF